jgi:hypothetical protein
MGLYLCGIVLEGIEKSSGIEESYIGSIEDSYIGGIEKSSIEVLYYKALNYIALYYIKCFLQKHILNDFPTKYF